MAVEWIGLGLAVVKIVMRLNDQADLADVVDDAAAGLRAARGSRRKQRDLGTILAQALQVECSAHLGDHPPADGEQQAAVDIAARVVAGLAVKEEALVAALAHPATFHQFVVDNGGADVRLNLVAERAEPVFDRILVAAADQIVALAPGSSRAMSAGMAELLRRSEVLPAISEDVAVIRAGVEALRGVNPETLRLRVAAVEASLPPYLAEEVAEVLDRVPGWAELALQLADSDVPARVIGRCVDDPPEWLDLAPGDAWVLVGHALTSYGARDAAADAYGAAVRRLVRNPDQIEALAALVLQTADDDGTTPGPRQQRIETLLLDNPCVLAQLLIAGRAGDLQAASQFAVQLPQDTPRDRERRAALRASTLTSCDRFREANEVLRDHLSTAKGVSVHLMLSNRLQDDALHYRSDSRSADLLEAVDLASTARQRCRARNVGVVPATLAAVQAAWNLDDLRLVRQMLNPPPEGDATEAETQDHRIRTFRAMLAADDGDDELAAQLAEGLGEFSRLRVAAISVIRREAADPTSKAVKVAWRSLWDVSRTDGERLVAAQGLLPHGGTAPDVDKLRAARPAAMAEIDAITDAVLPRPGEAAATRIRRLRKAAPTNRHAAVELGFALARARKTREAAAAWSSAADRLDDQRWRLQAAILLMQASDRPATITTAQNALSLSPPGWPGRGRAHTLAIEAAADDQEWDTVVSHARQLLTLHDQPEVRWVLAHALCELDELQKAWDVIYRDPVILDPVEGPQHQMWTRRRLQLVGQFGSHEQLLSCGVEALRYYRDDEQFTAAVIGAVLTGDARHPPAEDPAPLEGLETVSAEFTSRLNDFLTRFPDSPHLRSVSFDEAQPEQFIETLTELVAPHADVLDDANAKVRAGQLPVGALAAVTQRSYAEMVMVRAALEGVHLRRSDTATQQLEEDDLAAVLALPGPAALVDASALLTSSWLSDATSSLSVDLVDVQITKAALDDLRRARDALSIRNSGSLSYDKTNRHVIVAEPDEEGAKALEVTAIDLVTLGRTLRRITGVDESPLQLRGDIRPWLGLISTCRSKSLALWCDDVVLRDAARQENVRTFSTYTVLSHLRSTTAITQSDFEACLFDLTRHRCFDLPFELERLRIVAMIGRWRPGAASMALTRPAAWATDPCGCYQLLSEACAQRCANPEDLARWASHATRGLCATFHDVADASPSVIALLAGMLVTPNLAADAIRGLLEGVRIVTAPANVPDPWPGAVEILRDAVSRAHTGEETRIIMTAMASNLDHDDRGVIYRSLLAVGEGPSAR